MTKQCEKAKKKQEVGQHTESQNGNATMIVSDVFAVCNKTRKGYGVIIKVDKMISFTIPLAPITKGSDLFG